MAVQTNHNQAVPRKAGQAGRRLILFNMKTNTTNQPNTTGPLRDGARCKVVSGTHEGKSGTVHDIKTGKTGHVSITVKQSNGTRFKTLAKNVVVIKS